MDNKEVVWESYRILSYVNSLMEEVEETSEEERKSIDYHQRMATKHQTFFSKFPHLLTMICDQGKKFDLGRLSEMLGKRDEIHRGDRDLEETNKEMGQEYFDRYVAPVIGEEKKKK